MVHITDFFFLVNKTRYFKPFDSFWESKIVAIAFGVGTTIMDNLFDLFQSDWDLIIILGFVVVVDFITGVIASKKRKNTLNSLGMRQSIIKVIEYTAFLWIMVMIGNGFEKYANDDASWLVNQLSFIIKDVDVLAFLTIIWIEVISITENMTDRSGGIGKLIERVNNLLKKYEDKDE